MINDCVAIDELHAPHQHMSQPRNGDKEINNVVTLSKGAGVLKLQYQRLRSNVPKPAVLPGSQHPCSAYRIAAAQPYGLYGT
jgi:hypothetical protein